MDDILNFEERFQKFLKNESMDNLLACVDNETRNRLSGVMQYAIIQELRKDDVTKMKIEDVITLEKADIHMKVKSYKENMDKKSVDRTKYNIIHNTHCSNIFADRTMKLLINFHNDKKITEYMTTNEREHNRRRKSNDEIKEEINSLISKDKLEYCGDSEYYDMIYEGRIKFEGKFGPIMVIDSMGIFVDEVAELNYNDDFNDIKEILGSLGNLIHELYDSIVFKGESFDRIDHYLIIDLELYKAAYSRQIEYINFEKFSIGINHQIVDNI